MATVNIYKDVIQTLCDRRGRTGSSRLRPRARRDVRGAAPPSPCAHPHGTSLPRGLLVPVLVPASVTPKDLRLHSRYRLYPFPSPTPWPRPLPPSRAGEATAEGLRGSPRPPRRRSGGDRRTGGCRLPGPGAAAGAGTCCGRGRGRSGPRRGTAAAPVPGHPRPLAASPLPGSAAPFLPRRGVLSATCTPPCTLPSRARDVTGALCDVTQPHALGKGLPGRGAPWRRGSPTRL